MESSAKVPTWRQYRAQRARETARDCGCTLADAVRFCADGWRAEWWEAVESAIRRGVMLSRAFLRTLTAEQRRAAYRVAGYYATERRVFPPGWTLRDPAQSD